MREKLLFEMKRDLKKMQVRACVIESSQSYPSAKGSTLLSQLCGCM